jgi:hypothetical protein
MRADGVPINGESIIAIAKAKARDLGMDPIPVFSEGWLDNFKRCHGLKAYCWS